MALAASLITMYSWVRAPPDPLEFSMKKLRIYIAGPMSGHPNLNWDAFDRKERELSADGWAVVNPARMDRETGIDPENLGEYDYEDAARRDIEALRSCDAIYLMSGFQFSKGACWERALAKHWGLKRYYEIPREDHERDRINKDGIRK